MDRGTRHPHQRALHRHRLHRDPAAHATGPRPYFGGASPATERVAATEADVQLFWGEPLDGIADRIDRLRRLTTELDRDLPTLEYGLRITTLVP
ncbi:MAG TPA: LLM class flavin-dependent oxidoreductase [Actinocatenispora sp.]